MVLHEWLWNTITVGINAHRYYFANVRWLIAKVTRYEGMEIVWVISVCEMGELFFCRGFALSSPLSRGEALAENTLLQVTKQIAEYPLIRGPLGRGLVRRARGDSVRGYWMRHYFQASGRVRFKPRSRLRIDCTRYSFWLAYGSGRLLRQCSARCMLNPIAQFGDKIHLRLISDPRVSLPLNASPAG